jgi:hypothetical protein
MRLSRHVSRVGAEPPMLGVAVERAREAFILKFERGWGWGKNIDFKRDETNI